MTNPDERRITSYQQLGLVLAGLLLLTGATITVSRMDLGSLRIAASLSIAAAKACLVLFFFMHMRHSGRLVALTFLATLVIVTIFITFIFLDIPYR